LLKNENVFHQSNRSVLGKLHKMQKKDHAVPEGRAVLQSQACNTTAAVLSSIFLVERGLVSRRLPRPTD